MAGDRLFGGHIFLFSGGKQNPVSQSPTKTKLIMAGKMSKGLQVKKRGEHGGLPSQFMLAPNKGNNDEEQRCTATELGSMICARLKKRVRENSRLSIYFFGKFSLRDESDQYCKKQKTHRHDCEKRYREFIDKHCLCLQKKEANKAIPVYLTCPPLQFT